MIFLNTNNKKSLEKDNISSGGTVQILTINGKKFVTGLFWQPLTSPRNYMSEARTIGKKRHWDIVAIRKNIRIQAGFVSKHAGVTKGMYSLASVLAGQLGDSWIGAFQVDNNQYAVIAVHDGSIVPGYDVVTDRDEAMTLLKQGYQLFQYESEQLFAPADFEFSQYQKNLAELLVSRNLKREHRLKLLTFGLTKKELAMLGVYGIGILAGMYGWSQYENYEEKLAREEHIRQEQFRRAALERLNANTKEKQGAQALQHPWAGMPVAVDFVNACSAEIYVMPLNIAGWQINGAKCDAKTFTATYRRKATGTTVNAFIKSVGARFSGAPVFTEDGDAVTVTRGIKMFFGGDETLVQVDTAQNTFLSHFQTVDVRLKLIEKKTMPPPSTSMVAANWRMFNYQFETPIAPDILIRGLPNKQGVRITKMEMQFVEDDASLKWTVTGELYASK